MNEAEKTILDKISNLSQSQKKFLEDFLDEPETIMDSELQVKEDFLVLASLFKDLKNSTAYRLRKNKKSARNIYNKYVKEYEKVIEKDLYSILTRCGFQLRKGGYESCTLTSNDFVFTEEDKNIFDSIFPENKASNKDTVVVPHPDMTEEQLFTKDMENSKKHLSRRITFPSKEDSS